MGQELKHTGDLSSQWLIENLATHIYKLIVWTSPARRRTKVHRCKHEATEHKSEDEAHHEKKINRICESILSDICGQLSRRRNISKKNQTHMKQQPAIIQKRCHMKRQLQKSILKLAACSLRPCVCKLGNCCLNRELILVASVCLDGVCHAGHWLKQALLQCCATPNLKNETPFHLVLFASFVCLVEHVCLSFLCPDY